MTSGQTNKTEQNKEFSNLSRIHVLTQHIRLRPYMLRPFDRKTVSKFTLIAPSLKYQIRHLSFIC